MTESSVFRYAPLQLVSMRHLCERPDLGRVFDDAARVDMRQRDGNATDEMPGAVSAGEKIRPGARELLDVSSTHAAPMASKGR